MTVLGVSLPRIPHWRMLSCFRLGRCQKQRVQSLLTLGGKGRHDDYRLWRTSQDCAWLSGSSCFSAPVSRTADLFSALSLRLGPSTHRMRGVKAAVRPKWACTWFFLVTGITRILGHLFSLFQTGLLHMSPSVVPAAFWQPGSGAGRTMRRGASDRALGHERHRMLARSGTAAAWFCRLAGNPAGPKS